MMFIGYSLSDWNLRIIMRNIAEGIKSAATSHCSIQVTPTGIKPEDENKVKEYLKSYFETIQKVNLRIFWGSAIDFCQALSEKQGTIG
jgi:hypothetical protein